MTKKRIAIINLIVAILVTIFAVGYAFSWYSEDGRDEKFFFGGSSGSAYFAGGSGEADDPFIITNKYHMYNLCWLQNTGRFEGVRYYFKLGDDVVLDNNTWLPPIGTDDNPFIGDFDGDGHTITGLKITTNLNKLTNNPANNIPDFAFSRAVGFFGMTGNDGNTLSNIHNFILANPIVEVAEANAPYSSSGNYVAGIAVGHVSGKVSSVGILATDSAGQSCELDVLYTPAGSSKYSTFNSILGELDPGATSSVTGGGHSGGSGTGNTFGANLNTGYMYERLEKIYANKISATPSHLLPDASKDTNNGVVSYFLTKHEKMPFTIDDSLSTYVGSTAKEVDGAHNIGYLCGNQNKFYAHNRTFGDPMPKSGSTYTHISKTIPKWLYWMTAENIANDVYDEGSGTKALTAAEFTALPNNIQDFVLNLNNDDPLESTRMSQVYNNVNQVYSGNDSNGVWSPHGVINWMGKNYGGGYTSQFGYKAPVVDELGRNLAFINNEYVEGKFVDYVVTAEPASHGTNFTGKLYDKDGNYFINKTQPWAFTNAYGTITEDDEGYLLSSKTGGYCYDIYGDPLLAGGYGASADGEHLVYKTGAHAGEAVRVKDEWNNIHELTFETGSTKSFIDYRGGVALPNTGIWFKPSQPGKIRLIMYAEQPGDGFALIKGTRNDVDFNDIDENGKLKNPFKVDYDKSTTTITGEEVGKHTLPSYVLYYFEYEVTAADIAAGNVEYWLMQYGSGGAHFVYLDLGASEEGELDFGAIDESKQVSAVDFIYPGVQISTVANSVTGINIGDFVIGGNRYEATKTSIYFENLSLSLQMVYLRKYNESSGITIQVSTNPTTTEVLATKPAYAAIL